MTTAEPITSTRPTDQEFREFLRRFARELNSLDKELQLYALEHKRVQERFARLHGVLNEYLSHWPILELKVAGDSLADLGDAPSTVEQMAAITQISSALRASMIQAVQFSTGLDEQEVREFVVSLLHRRQEESETTWAHILVKQYPHHFLRFAGDGTGESNGLARVTVPAAWQGFDPRQLKAVAEVMNAPVVLHRLAQFRGAERQTEQEQLDYVSRLLELLCEDTATDWSSKHHIEQKVIAGLDLLEEVQRQAAEGPLAMQLVVPKSGVSDHLLTRFRWRLLRNFFPQGIDGSSPRVGEDLAMQGLGQVPGVPELLATAAPPVDDSHCPNSKAAWRPQAALEHLAPSRIEPVIAELRAALGKQFGPEQLLSEYLALSATLLNGADLDEGRRVQTQFLHLLKQAVTVSAAPEPLLARLYSSGDWQSLERPGPITAQALRMLRPERVLRFLVRGDLELECAVLSTSPLAFLRAETPEGRLEPFDAVREQLRRSLAPRDDFAFSMLFAILNGDNGALARQHGWLDLLEAMSTNCPALRDWAERHASELVHADQVPLLLRLPIEESQSEISKQMLALPAHVLQRLLAALGEHSHPSATRYLLNCLSHKDSRLSELAIQGLGNQRDLTSLLALQNRLRDFNERTADNQQIDCLCAAIAAHDNAESRAFLTAVIRERGIWSHRWRRPIRRAARLALKQLPQPSATA
ncbi:MAG: hypothetical protein ACKVX7_06935 [Planctomycetota bacterium]